MQAFSGISRLLLALLLQLLPAQMAHLPEIPPSKVIGFQEVLVKSMCQPMEQLVDVEHSFPEEVEYIYIPACVSLWRCSGCCGDENMQCHPTLERNITLPVVRIYPIMSSEYVQVTFVEHQSCECRPRQDLHHDNSSTESNKKRKRKHKKTAGCEKCQNKINHQ